MRKLKRFAWSAFAFVFTVGGVALTMSAGVNNLWEGGRVATRHIIGGAVNASKLSDGLLYHRYAWERMDAQPSCSAPNGYGDPTGTTGDTNRCMWRSGLTASYHVKGTQTLLAPLLDTTGKGLDISQDQTDNDGVEYVFGALNTYGNFTKTVGTDSAFCVRASFTIADVSGTDDCIIGWRKNEAMQAAVDDYDEMAGLNVILGDIKTETILNNAATTTTDTTLNWLDGETHDLEVCIVGRRAHYYVDGAERQRAVTFDFDTSEVVVPFFYFLQATTTPGKVWWKEVEVYDKSEASRGE